MRLAAAVLLAAAAFAVGVLVRGAVDGGKSKTAPTAAVPVTPPRVSTSIPVLARVPALPAIKLKGPRHKRTAAPQPTPAAVRPPATSPTPSTPGPAPVTPPRPSSPQPSPPSPPSSPPPTPGE
jgi:hypothetical protein